MNTLDLKVEAAPGVFLACRLRATEMAQLGKGLANNPDGLSLIPGTCNVELPPPHTHTNKCNKTKYLLSF